MKTISIAAVRNDVDSFLAALTDGEEEILLIDGSREVAHIIPEARGATLEEIFAGPDDRLDEEAGAALAAAVEQVRNASGNRLSAQRKLWPG